MPCRGCSNKIGVEHFRPRRQRVIPQIEKCDLCGTISWDVSYCSFCGKWLCKKCARDPLRRFKGMMKEKVLKKKELY